MGGRGVLSDLESGGGGDDGEAMEMGFFLCIVRSRMHEFEAKKKQGKNCAMQRHEQVLPPCRCIAQINEGELLRVDSMWGQWGVGGGEVLDKIGRGAHLSRHPLPKFGFLFLGFF